MERELLDLVAVITKAHPRRIQQIFRDGEQIWVDAQTVKEWLLYRQLDSQEPKDRGTYHSTVGSTLKRVKTE